MGEDDTIVRQRPRLPHIGLLCVKQYYCSPGQRPRQSTLPKFHAVNMFLVFTFQGFHWGTLFQFNQFCFESQDPSIDFA